MNAQVSGIDNAKFYRADLSEPAAGHPEWWDCDLVMLDPPRTGAAEILAQVAESGARRVLYVSCHPGALARDAKHLVHEFGYDLAAAGVMDMFPHTSHVESMALFQK